MTDSEIEHIGQMVFHAMPPNFANHTDFDVWLVGFVAGAKHAINAMGEFNDAKEQEHGS
jgi:hypothetical protein